MQKALGPSPHKVTCGNDFNDLSAFLRNFSLLRPVIARSLRRSNPEMRDRSPRRARALLAMTPHSSFAPKGGGRIGLSLRVSTGPKNSENETNLSRNET